MKQAIDVVRALLRKPAVLISEIISYSEAEEVLCDYLANTTIIFVNPTLKSLKKCSCSKLLFVWKGVLAESGSPDSILKNKNSFFVKKYLPTRQEDHRERVEDVSKRQRSKSKVFKSEEVTIPV